MYCKCTQAETQPLKITFLNGNLKQLVSIKNSKNEEKKNFKRDLKKIIDRFFPVNKDSCINFQRSPKVAQWLDERARLVPRVVVGSIPASKLCSTGLPMRSNFYTKKINTYRDKKVSVDS